MGACERDIIGVERQGDTMTHDIPELRVSDFDRENVRELLRDIHKDWFSAMLFRLIAKADADNRALLRRGFPDHVDVIEKHLGLFSTKDWGDEA
ncbi:hypothetical protein LCGC14_2935540 [marine sediment metagenome]|uniref:Uncharacterized protein n=1 Tax=marine sediment metagenome TaxID=412755 RepID=A0A0F8ZS80_9ZZZZ